MTKTAKKRQQQLMTLLGRTRVFPVFWGSVQVGESSAAAADQTQISFPCTVSPGLPIIQEQPDEYDVSPEQAAAVEAANEARPLPVPPAPAAVPTAPTKPMEVDDLAGHAQSTSSVFGTCPSERVSFGTARSCWAGSEHFQCFVTCPSE